LDRGREALKKAIAIGQADGIVMPFAENAPCIMDILVSLAHDDSCNEYFKYHMAVPGGLLIKFSISFAGIGL
jgi:hypothetical protein